MNDQRSSEYLKFRLKKLLPFFGGRRAADITTADIRRYIVSRQAGVSREEIAAELRKLQADYAAKVERIEKSGCGKRVQRKQLGLFRGLRNRFRNLP